MLQGRASCVDMLWVVIAPFGTVSAHNGGHTGRETAA